MISITKKRRHYWELPESTKEAYRRANRKKQKEYFDAGLCVNCGKRPPVTKLHCGDCCVVFSQRNKRRNEKLKDEVFAAYGGAVCRCCGITVREFLTMDHENGRASHGHSKNFTGPVLYRWLKKNNFPSGFRVLCYNCNCSRGRFGYCPHEREQELRRTQ